MFEVILAVVCLLIGWSVPAPAFATKAIAWIKAKLHIGS